MYRAQVARVASEAARLRTPPEFRIPPGPRIPALIQGARLMVGHAPDRKRYQRRYGDVFTLRLPVFGKTVVVADPKLAKEVFGADPAILYGGNTPLGRVLGGSSLFSLNEESYAEARKILMPPFHGARMKSYDSIVEEEALKEIAAWPEGEEFATLPSMRRITLSVILRAIFGAEGEELEVLRSRMPVWVKFGERLIAMQFLFRDLGPGSPYRRYMRYRAEFDGYIDRLIDKARRGGRLEEREDVLALLLRATHEDGSSLSRKQIGDHLLSLVIAGHETTGGSLAWSVERLRRHPSLVRRLVEEADRGGGELRDATVREVQRTRPVIGGPVRIVNRPFELGEWLLPPGCSIIVAGLLMHDDPRYFKHADRFDPDRFLAGKPPPFAWVPFGGGARRCIGAAFATMETDVVLRTLLRNVELVPTDEPGEPWKYQGGTNQPARGGQARIVHRRRPT
jgi:cytochrome P450 family 138